VAFVTAVILPAARALPAPGQRLDFFEQVERRFAAQVRLSVPVAGLSGFYLAWRLDCGERFTQIQSWWLAAMVLLWILFMAILFVVEPLFGIAAIERLAGGDVDRLFALLQRAHVVLLGLSLVIVVGAILGAHGYLG
jgi:uncharacterized membrane protein